MSRTDLDAATLARSLRLMAGDGSMEWAMEPIQTRVLLDVADLLAENTKLRKILTDACTYLCLVKMSGPLAVEIDEHNVYWDGEKILSRMLELRIEDEVDE